MEFRPCIDIHNGQVKQIVGSSLVDKNDKAVENFVASADAAYYAKLYREKGLKGGMSSCSILSPAPIMNRQRRRRCLRLALTAAVCKSAGASTQRMRPYSWRQAHRM